MFTHTEIGNIILNCIPLFFSPEDALRKISFYLSKLEKGKRYNLVQANLGVELKWIKSTKVSSLGICVVHSLFTIFIYCVIALLMLTAYLATELL